MEGKAKDWKQDVMPALVFKDQCQKLLTWLLSILQRLLYVCMYCMYGLALCVCLLDRRELHEAGPNVERQMKRTFSVLDDWLDSQ